MPDGAWTLLGMLAVALLVWYLSRRKDDSVVYQSHAAGDLSYADMAEKAWKDAAQTRELLAQSEAREKALQANLDRIQTSRVRDRALTAERFALITPIMQKCLESHPEHKEDFDKFQGIQFTEQLNGGAG